jgi:hypothetical protein
MTKSHEKIEILTIYGIIQKVGKSKRQKSGEAVFRLVLMVNKTFVYCNKKMISKIDIFLYSGNVISQFLEMSYL